MAVGRTLRRIAGTLFIVVASAAAGLIVTLAMPVGQWRTGERWPVDLPSLGRSALPAPAERIWVDTDAACGADAKTDPDDCLAILYLAARGGVEIAGISTVFGNAALPVTDETARELSRLMERQFGDGPPVRRGAAARLSDRTGAPTDAEAALADALTAAPLTIVALGPLTNIAAVLETHPQLAHRIVRIVAVMGRRSGHVFHPSEGSGLGSLFGHGPIFRDFNAIKDTDAVAVVLASGVPLALVPYEAARQVEIEAGDLEEIAATGPAGRWVADRAGAWLGYWNEDIGRPGFYPFDLVAAAFAVAPERFDCVAANAAIGTDDSVPFPMSRWPGLLVEPVPAAASDTVPPLLYCHGLRDGADIWPASNTGQTGSRRSTDG